jgi:IS4 transposase
VRICDEMRDGDFGDQRLTRRMTTIVRQLADAPAKSFPKATGGDASLEATYRFLNNESVEPEAILAPHYRATVERCERAGKVIVPHDTTAIHFSGERSELGRLNTSDYGFIAHVALAMDLRRTPLGIVGMQTLFREHGTRRTKHSERQPLAKRESRRWLELVRTVEERLAGRAQAIHVMDREADFYELIAPLTTAGHKFVIRLQFDRATEWGTIRDELESTPPRLQRAVEISARPAAKQPRKARRHPPRQARTAHLLAAAKRVTIQRAKHLPDELPDAVTLNVVRIYEPCPPDQCEPVEWLLLTTEPIDTVEEISTIIEIYRARWVIEEYFKALKTGCAFEKRQLENRHAILNALALLAPIAWRLLLLRSHASHAPDAPATEALTALQFRILQRHERTQLAPTATVADAMLAIAALGGHIKNNGPPGWQVLGRGFEDLLVMERGAALLERCDQS